MTALDRDLAAIAAVRDAWVRAVADGKWRYARGMTNGSPQSG
ncbi:MAG TPA: hypothetical protein VH277_09755 [Gemmatimonadaceae bacterium]|nr:hypothetical protein [Gemmatimonadaceae bacterium]